MLPVLLEAAPQVSDPTTMAIAGLSACVAFMAGILSTILLAKLNSLTKKIESLEKSHGDKTHALELTVSQLTSGIGIAAAKIVALEDKGLTKEYFALATENQNRVLNAQTDSLAALNAKVLEIDKVKVTRSEINMAAARPAYRAPIPRTDGPTDSDPPPVRAHLPSRV